MHSMLGMVGVWVYVCTFLYGLIEKHFARFSWSIILFPDMHFYISIGRISANQMIISDLHLDKIFLKNLPDISKNLSLMINILSVGSVFNHWFLTNWNFWFKYRRVYQSFHRNDWMKKVLQTIPRNRSLYGFFVECMFNKYFNLLCVHRLCILRVTKNILKWLKISTEIWILFFS